MTSVFFVVERSGAAPTAIFQDSKSAVEYIDDNGGREKYYVEQWVVWRSYGDLQQARDTIARRGEL